uniref:Uncharacterized protein n=1 Tax=Oryza sativa subsp. japonica TaxID=39947 RepID=Q2R3Y7_ORYSJ|nr:hypothetical protein LOC_Os11g30320 [Oryza sativa Japonica Group]
MDAGEPYTSDSLVLATAASQWSPLHLSLLLHQQQPRPVRSLSSPPGDTAPLWPRHRHQGNQQPGSFSAIRMGNALATVLGTATKLFLSKGWDVIFHYLKKMDAGEPKRATTEGNRQPGSRGRSSAGRAARGKEIGGGGGEGWGRRRGGGQGGDQHGGGGRDLAGGADDDDTGTAQPAGSETRGSTTTMQAQPGPPALRRGAQQRRRCSVARPAGSETRGSTTMTQAQPGPPVLR